MAHFGDWGMEVHAGKPGKHSKSEILFCPAPSSVYADAATYDDADLSEVQLPGGLSMPVVFVFDMDYLKEMCKELGVSQLALAKDFAKFETKFANARASAKFREICLFSEDVP